MVFTPLENHDNLEFHDNFFDCPFGDENDPACTAYAGNFVMDQLGIPRDYVTTASLALVGFIAFYVLSSWLFLQFIPVKITFSKQVQSSEKEIEEADGLERSKSPGTAAKTVSTTEQRPTEITVKLQDMRLWIDKWMPIKQSKVNILQGITAEFEPGKLNVIMGPSGTFSRV
jgi:hypothetical protein